MAVEITYRFTDEPSGIRAIPADPADALQRLNAGNRSFAELLKDACHGAGTMKSTVEVDSRLLGLNSDDRQVAPHQPFAAVPGVCGCARADRARFQRRAKRAVRGPGGREQSRNRRAGKLPLRDRPFAAKRLRLLAVLGHSGCGALTAAVDVFLDPGGYLAIATNEQLRSIVDRHLIAVQASARALARTHGNAAAARPGYRAALIETAIATNAALAAYTLQAELHARGCCAVEGCLWRVPTGNALRSGPPGRRAV